MSTRVREAREVSADDDDLDLADLSDEELDALLEEDDEDEDDEEDDAPVVRKQPTKSFSTGKKLSSEPQAPVLPDTPPKGTALLMLGLTAVATVLVFAMRVVRRKKTAGPKRVDTPIPTLAVAGGTNAKNGTTKAYTKSPLGKAPKEKGGTTEKGAAQKQCANCDATALKVKKTNPDGTPSVPKLLRCGGCRSVYYCSSECQRAHRAVHKAACVAAISKTATKPTAQPGASALTATARPYQPNAQPTAQRTAQPTAQPTTTGATTATQPVTQSAAPTQLTTTTAGETEAEGRRQFAQLRAKLGQATAAFWRGQSGPAVSALQDIAMKAHELQAEHKLGRELECEALRMAAHGMIRMRAFEPAERCLDACLSVAKEGKNDEKPLPPGAEIGAFVGLGTLESSRTPPNLELAKEWYAQALGIAREAGDVAAEAAVCQNLAGVAGKMGDSSGAAEACEMALGLRRAKVEEVRADLAATEQALSEFTKSDEASDEASHGQQPAQPQRGVITSAEHAKAFGATQGAKRALAEAKRAEIAALANVGAALLKIEDKEEGDENVNSADVPSLATRVAAGVARYEEALVSLRSEASGMQDLEMEIGLLLELANAHDNRVGGEDGAERARGFRGTLRDAVHALTGGQREFPSVCTLCDDNMDDEHTPPDPSKPSTCLECLHGYHTACISRWRSVELGKISEDGDTSTISQNHPNYPRCPDCVKVRKARARGQTV